LPSIDVSQEAELALTKLLDKLGNWLVAQPEWPLLLAGDRAGRKRAADAIAKHLVTIPAARFEEPRLGRALARRIVRELAKQDENWWR